MKKVLLIVIDALATRIVRPAMDEGRLPHFKQLAVAGMFRDDCTSIFPSITPAATASIVTGRYPAEHQIAGAFWYDHNHRRVAYYCDDFWVIVNQGLGDFFHDFLIKLNYQRLQSETLYEQVERAGLSAGVINYMWFRGDVDHDVDAPLLMKLLPGVTLAPRIRGPQLTALGDFVRPVLGADDQPMVAAGGLSRRYGFHDESTADYLLQLAEADALPDFTLAYFPNNDFESHRVGPGNALHVLEEIDACLGRLFEVSGGLDKLIERSAILVTGDHSQSDMVASDKEQSIDLSETLSSFEIVPAGSDWSGNEELMVCPNMRAAQIYLSEQLDPAHRQAVLLRLLDEPRIDQVIWVDEQPGGTTFHVSTADRGTLNFRLAGDAQTGITTDDYNNAWVCDGEFSAVDAYRSPKRRICYGDYPNALERIAGAFNSVSGDIWATSRVGHEFCVPGIKTHPGGSHGSLHALDSTAPLIAAGVPANVEVPVRPRTTDIAPLCLKLLDLPAGQLEHQLAAS